MISKTSVAIVIPVFNDEKGLLAFIPKLIRVISERPTEFEKYQFHVVIIDDGSRTPVNQHTLEIFLSSSNTTLSLLRHPVNLGQGAALQTGIDYSKQFLKVDIYVTMDSDGQHSEDDFFPMLACLESSGVDIVFGNRFSSKASSGIPLSRKILLMLAIAFEYYLTGVRLNDAHNGFRAFNSNCAQVLELRNNRMAHATEFKQIVKKKNLRYGEFPVRVQYTEESLKRGQRNTGSLIILKDLLKMYLFERFS